MYRSRSAGSTVRFGLGTRPNGDAVPYHSEFSSWDALHNLGDLPGVLRNSNDFVGQEAGQPVCEDL
jgi:hypothetical protein